MAELHRQVAAMQEKIAGQRRKMGSINAARECDIQVLTPPHRPHPCSTSMLFSGIIAVLCIWRFHAILQKRLRISTPHS